MEEVSEITLPAFALDCRDWWVTKPGEAGLPEHVGGAPIVAVLSTALVLDGVMRSASGVLSLGLLDDGDCLVVGGPTSAPAARGDTGISRLLDVDSRLVSFLIPSPIGRLGLLAEFRVDDGAGPDLIGRVEALMASFRWAD